MSGGPGGLFPLLRSAAAAEIARHFGTPEGAPDAPVTPARTDAPQTAAQTSVPQRATGSVEPVLPDLTARPQGQLAIGLASLAPPRLVPQTLPAGLAQNLGPQAATPVVVPGEAAPTAPSNGGDVPQAAPAGPALPVAPRPAAVAVAVDGQAAVTLPSTESGPGAMRPAPPPTAKPAVSATAQPGNMAAGNGLPTTVTAATTPTLVHGSGQPLPPGLTSGHVADLASGGGATSANPLPTSQPAVAIAGGTPVAPAIPADVAVGTTTVPMPGQVPVADPKIQPAQSTAFQPADLPAQATSSQTPAPQPDKAAPARQTVALPMPQQADTPATPMTDRAPSPTIPTGESAPRAATALPLSQAVLAPAIAEALATGGFPLTVAGQGASAASLVIFNAAMIPSWPPALRPDAPQQLEAALRAGGAVMAQMTPEEAAEYLAKMAAAFGFLLTVKKRLAQSLKEEKEMLLGLFSFLGVALDTLSRGLQMALDLTTEQRAMLEELALVQSDDGGRPPHRGRQRLRL